MSVESDWDDISPIQASQPKVQFEVNTVVARLKERVLSHIQNYFPNLSGYLRANGFNESQARNLEQTIAKLVDDAYRRRTPDDLAYSFAEYLILGLRLDAATLQELLTGLPTRVLNEMAATGMNTGVGGVLALELLKRSNDATYKLVQNGTTVTVVCGGDNDATEFNLYEIFEDT